MGREILLPRGATGHAPCLFPTVSGLVVEGPALVGSREDEDVPLVGPGGIDLLDFIDAIRGYAHRRPQFAFLDFFPASDPALGAIGECCRAAIMRRQSDADRQAGGDLAVYPKDRMRPEQ